MANFNEKELEIIGQYNMPGIYGAPGLYCSQTESSHHAKGKTCCAC